MQICAVLVRATHRDNYSLDTRLLKPEVKKEESLVYIRGSFNPTSCTRFVNYFDNLLACANTSMTETDTLLKIIPFHGFQTNQLEEFKSCHVKIDLRPEVHPGSMLESFLFPRLSGNMQVLEARKPPVMKRSWKI